MTSSRIQLVLAAALLAMTPACAFHNIATHWNGLVGPDGHPVHVRTVSNLGINLAILLPVAGKTTIDEMVEEVTAEIAKRGGNHIDVFETSSENYWYGVPPITWFITPVITDVSVQYRPSEEEVAEYRARDAALEKKAAERRARDNSHILPDPGRQR